MPADPSRSRGAASTVGAGAAPPTAAGSGTVLGVLIVSTFVVFLNETIMGVALPTLIVQLDITAATAQWLTTGFLLTMGVVIPVTGFLLQRLHTRQVFVLAMGVFSVGTLAAAVAPGFPVLMAARVAQGFGTAIMVPLLMTTAMRLVPPGARGRTMGRISIVISVAPAVGPTISGIILDALSWRFMFLVVLPIAVAALILGALKLRNVTEPRRLPIDVLSVVLSALAFGGLLYSLSEVGEEASGAPQPVVPLVPAVVGALMLGLFVLRQLRLIRVAAPLLDLRVFRSRNFSLSVGLMSLANIGFFGTLVILPIYLQSVLGIDTLTTGLLLLPGGAVMGLLSPIAGRIYDRAGPVALVVVGSVLVSAALWGMALVLHRGTPLLAVLALHTLLSIGLTLTFTPLSTVSLASLRPELYSHGSATSNTVQQVMAGAGTALFVTLLATRAESALAAGAGAVEATAAGVQAAFLAGGIISLVAVVAACFLRTPESEEVGPHRAQTRRRRLTGAARPPGRRAPAGRRATPSE
ncbi:MAG: DHA2 family efflux MFS transporter permease subunit [Amnibacterium sp.]